MRMTVLSSRSLIHPVSETNRAVPRVWSSLRKVQNISSVHFVRSRTFDHYLYIPSVYFKLFILVELTFPVLNVINEGSIGILTETSHLINAK